MVWILRRIEDVLYNPANLGVPKHVLIEEIFSNMKNKQLLESALASIKTVRKNLGGVTLIGQSANDPGEHADSIVNSCTSFLFLPDATFNRRHYGELFKLTDQQLSVVTNHIDGGIAGPIIVMLTTDYYSHDHQQLLLPQGTRLIGNVQNVGGQHQRKLLVVFNRAVCPDGFSFDLNKYAGLDPIGTAGLATNVNNHVASSFAAAAAIGGLGGLTQIGNNGTVLSADTQIRNGISIQSGMEAEQTLDYFLNRLPTITVKEGSRARVYINQDTLIPSYA